MQTAEECRKLASDYRRTAEENGVSPRKANLLRNIANSLSGLASQFELLTAVAAEESRDTTRGK
ncbi:hypothetical protein D6B98_35080 [Bradyrhizobium sp. LVM 105]|nr:hypothetical protein D6B98_35080 [Bradyrhizobium sp. LVM 105]